MDAHTSVVSITCLLMLTMLVQTYTSDSIDGRLRRAFLHGFAIILFCAVLDWTRVELKAGSLKSTCTGRLAIIPLYLRIITLTLQVMVKSM